MVATWQKSKPLNINSLEKDNKIKKVDPNLKVTSIQSADYVYNGQVKKVTAGSRRRLLSSGEHLVS